MKHSFQKPKFIALLLVLGCSTALGNQPALNGSIVIKDIPSNEAELDVFIKNMNEQTLPRLRNLDECVATGRFLLESYGDIKRLFLGKNPKQKLLLNAAPGDTEAAYNLNVEENFKILQAGQTEALNAIKSFSDKLAVKDNLDRNQIEAKLKSLDAEILSLSRKVSEASYLEDAFLYVLGRADIELSKNLNESTSNLAMLFSDQCKEANLAPVGEKIVADLNLILATVGRMKAYVTESRTKREKLIEYTYTFHRYALEQAYLKQAGNDLTELQNRLMGVLAFGRLATEMETWWSDVIARGVGDRLHTKYLQYEEALMRLKSTRETAQQYKERIESFPGVAENARAVFLNRITNFVTSLDQTIQQIESKGWQGQLSKQKTMVEGMQKIVDRYVESCPPMLNQFLAQFEQVKSIEQYRIAETLYAQIVDTCKSK
jgi:hypothetical protein